MGLPRNRLEATSRIVEPMLAAQMLFGGAGTSIAWLLFAFGSIFGWVFASHADLTGWRFRPSAIATVGGTAEDCRSTGYIIGGSDGSDGARVMRTAIAIRSLGRSPEAGL